MRIGGDGLPTVYAPYGYDDLFAMVVRPDRRHAPRHVHESRAARWKEHRPELTVLPWEEPEPPNTSAGGKPGSG